MGAGEGLVAHSLGRTVVAEGVETAAQKDELVKRQSDSCQGFYFARPMPAASLDALIQDYAGRQDRYLPAPT